MLLSLTLFSSSGYAEEKDKSWKGAVSEADLVKVVNFLMNNKGKEIKLDEKKHTITGKEELNIQITILPCCNENMFRKYISTFGVVKDVKFPTFYAIVSADAIQELDKNGEIVEIKFEPEKRDLWIKAIQQ